MSNHEFKEKCREIARRDRILRPMQWLSIIVIALLLILHHNEILPKPVSNVLACVGCVFWVVVYLLWEHNLRCPVCARRLLSDYRWTRMRLIALPETHICKNCGAQLTFTGEGLL
ncbi:MAG: hypothetical protein IJ042_02240 [Butyricicoccus sp.]|nr:hypothetical protein [Butyricicoccus sp.]